MSCCSGLLRWIASNADLAVCNSLSGIRQKMGIRFNFDHSRGEFVPVFSFQNARNFVFPWVFLKSLTSVTVSTGGQCVPHLNKKYQFFFFSAVIWHRGALSLRQISLQHTTTTLLHFPFWRFARVWFPPNDPRRDRSLYTRARKEVLKIPTKSILAFQKGLFTLGRQLKKNIHI